MLLPYPPTFIEKVRQIVHENLTSDTFSVEELAKHLSLSSSQVYRKIKQQTGLSPSAYIRRIRLEEAHHRIEQSSLTLSLIAYQVGFSCLSYFSRCFVEEYGYVPSSLRK